jgi:hypothetical protein
VAFVNQPPANRTHVLVRVWLPDRPGALGQVAARIGAVRGDIVGVDVLECAGGIAIDEFAVNLADPEVVSILVREIEEVDGASIEEVRIVNHFPDPRLDALGSATRLCAVDSVAELHEALTRQVQEEFLAEWSALICGFEDGGEDKGTVLATAGSAPPPEMLGALAVGLGASPLVASGETGPEDLATASLPVHAATLLVERQGYPFRLRERGQLNALARIADRLWELLGSKR